MEEAIADDPMVFGKSLRTQITEVIVNPLGSMSMADLRPKVTIIDGLDECLGQDQRTEEYRRSSENAQLEILDAIGYALEQKKLPLRILIAS